MSAARKSVSVRVNDEPRSFAEAATVLDALRELGLAERRGIAIAVDDTVVARSQWATRPLANGERLLVIQATQGG